MNKKILSIFVMVMALSLLGVSCNKKTTDPTNDGGSTTTSLTLSEINEKIAALGKVYMDANDIIASDTAKGQNFDFSSASGETASLTVQGADNATSGAAAVPAQKLVDHLKSNLTDVTVAVTGGVPSGNNSNLVVTVSSGENIVTITIKPSSSNWK